MFYWPIGGSRTKEAKKDHEIGIWDRIEKEELKQYIQKVVIMLRLVSSLVSLIMNSVLFK